jgi:hypothetical protein
VVLYEESCSEIVCLSSPIEESVLALLNAILIFSSSDFLYS